MATTMKNESAKWTPIGNVVGTASNVEFTFVMKSYHGRVGDIVAVRMLVPSEQLGREVTAVVWGRVVAISRYNPFFPVEAAQELANEGIRPLDTVLSISRDQLEARCVVLGFTLDGDPDFRFQPLTYPIEPAGEVLRPPKDALEGLLTGPRAEHTDDIPIGHLISRPDVEVKLETIPLLARHMAVLAMTGGGKTVAARTIIHHLATIGYPVLILDPHGDYLGFYHKKDRLPDGTVVRVFYPHLSLSSDNAWIVTLLLEKMTTGQTEPQRHALEKLMKDNPVSGQTLSEYFATLRKKAFESMEDEDGGGKGKGATLGVVIRQVNIVEHKLQEMERMNQTIRQRIPGTSFEQLPDTTREPWEIIAPKHVSILYLGGYDHLTQSTIVSIVMENLFGHRARLDGTIPPFFTVVEEAHNFIPGGTETTAGTPSLETLQKVITEGRKFGTGLLLVSQRPSRIDATLLSQCNTFLVLRLVNPNDQGFVRRVMENLTDEDARVLPAFGPGQGIVSGQAVRFPVLVNIRMIADFQSPRLGTEDFISEVDGWRKPSAAHKLGESDRRIQQRAARRKRKDQ